MVETPLMTRRRFFQALAASVVAVGLPLPAGIPLNAAVVIHQYEITKPWDLTTMYFMHTSALAEGVVASPHVPYLAFNADGTKMYATAVSDCDRAESGQRIATVEARTETAF